MKIFKLLFITLILSITHSYAQLNVTTITSENKDHYITTIIDYPIVGTYLYEGKSEPLINLDANGTGVFQFEDLTKKNILWGIECDQSGTPIFKKGFDSAAYTLWYKSENSFETGGEDWISVHFSIHFNKNKIFILGNRSKDYVDAKEKE